MTAMFRPTRSLSYAPALNTANERWSGSNTHSRRGTSISSGCLWMRDGTRSERNRRSSDSSNAAGSQPAHRSPRAQPLFAVAAERSIRYDVGRPTRPDARRRAARVRFQQSTLRETLQLDETRSSFTLKPDASDTVTRRKL